NELYNSSVQKTTKFLLELTSAVTKGTLLLVVDSPGSYSTVSFNGPGGSSNNGTAAEKKYPMQWLLGHTLLKTACETEPGLSTTMWKKLISEDSRWFRLPNGLRYPIEL